MINNKISLILLAVLSCLSGCAKNEPDTVEANFIINNIASQNITKDLTSERFPLTSEEPHTDTNLSEETPVTDSVEYVEVPTGGEESFFASYGFGDDEPFYCYESEELPIRLTLYYDEDSCSGCGIRYWRSGGGTSVMSGFAFSGCEDTFWDYPNPYSTCSVDDENPYDTKNYQEVYEYDNSGKILSFRSSGTSHWYGSYVSMSEDILSLDFFYRNDGTLRKREYSHNHHFFGTTNQSHDSYYDEKERLVYTNAYVTHGSLECYYIYEGESGTPSYCLTLDNQYNAYPHLYRYVSGDTADWMWFELPRGGKSAFQAQLGFSGCEPFYQYSYETRVYQNSLTLYYDDAQMCGGGFLDITSNGVQGEYTTTYGFLFQSVEHVDTTTTNPFSVYAFYPDGKKRYAGSGSTLPEMFNNPGGDIDEYLGYDNDRLMYVDLYYGTQDWFYIYDAKNTSPSYCIELDIGEGASFYRFSSQ